MKTVTLYTVSVSAQQVELGDGYTLSHSVTHEPRCAIGNGMVLLGIEQMPPRSVQRCQALPGVQGAEGEEGDAYIALAPELRRMLEAPILAAAQHEIERQRAELLADMASGPWWLRVWRALWRTPSAQPPAGPCAAAPA